MNEPVDVHIVFHRDLHELFARISRDFNPLHMDPVWARRTPLGAPIVHGVHSLLWLLEALAAQRQLPRACTLKAEFRKPIYIGESCSAEIRKCDAAQMRAHILVCAEEAVAVTLRFAPHEQTSATAAPQHALPPPEIPAACSLDEMSGVRGALQLDGILVDCIRMFPHATEY